MNKEIICEDCGTIDLPKYAWRGNCLVEIVLWIFFVLPGIFYSIWRSETKHKVCKACGSPNVHPVGSLIGRQVMREYSADDKPHGSFGEEDTVDILVACKGGRL